MGTAASRRISVDERKRLKERIRVWSQHGMNPTDCPGTEGSDVSDTEFWYAMQLASLPRAKQVMVAARGKVQERYPDDCLDNVFPVMQKIDFMVTDPVTDAVYHLMGTINYNLGQPVKYIPPHLNGMVPPDTPDLDIVLAWAKLAAHQRKLTLHALPKMERIVEECSTFRQIQRLVPNMVPMFPKDVIDDLRSALRKSRPPVGTKEYTGRDLIKCEQWVAMSVLLEERSKMVRVSPIVADEIKPPRRVERAQSSSGLEELSL